MERLGQYLRAERNKRGMSLDEVAARTRIRLQTLEALERDDYPMLPAEVTVKGFLRAYARCLALDEQQVLARYQEFAAEYFKVTQDADAAGSAAQASRQRAWQHRLTVVGLTAAAVMVVISGVVALSPRDQPEHPTDISSPIHVPRPPVAVPVPEPITDTPTVEPVPGVPPTGQPSVIPEPATTPPREAAKPQQLAVTATETSWVQVTIDNGEPREALLQPGERVGWEAEQTFTLTVGNAGGVAVEFNGERLPTLGPGGKVRTLVLPRAAINAGGQTASRAVPPVSAAGSPRRDEPSPTLTSPLDSTTVPPRPLQ